MSYAALGGESSEEETKLVYNRLEFELNNNLKFQESIKTSEEGQSVQVSIDKEQREAGKIN